MSLPDIPIGAPLDAPTFLPTDIPVRVGEILAGKYRVDRILGAGGMGVVVAATHLLLEQVVALKFMLRTAHGDPDLAERFLREARAMARLRGEHVVRVLDLGLLEDGAPYMVMELLEGRDLRSVLLEAREIPVRDVVSFVAQACEAVAEAHARGVIHRDLKPHNLFVTTSAHGEECVKVLDFGISKIASDPALTRPTALLGSPHYMAPEQIATPGEVDGRADIWALGVCLYQLLTKRTPFEAHGLIAFSDKLLNTPPVPVERYRHDLPPGLLRIIERCLEKSPERRFATATDLARALRTVSEVPSARRISTPPVPGPSTIAPVAIRNGARSEPPPSLPPPAPRASGTRAKMVGLTAALFVAGVAVGVVGRTPAAPQEPPQAAMDLTDVPQPAEPVSARLSPEPRPPATGVPMDDARPPATAEGATRGTRPHRAWTNARTAP